MKGFKKKALSALLTLAMVVGMLQPMAAEAAEAANVALNKTVTAANMDGTEVFLNTSGGPELANLVDGAKTTSPYDYVEMGYTSANETTKGISYLQIDLGQTYDISELKLWRYYADGRTYGETVIAIADEEADFPENTTDTVYDATVVFNVEVESESYFEGNFGKGTDATYAETSEGKTITLEETVTGRYVRLYATGRDANNRSHVIELEVYGVEPTVKVDKTALTAKIAEAQALTEADYTADSWTALQTAIAAAQAVVDDTTATADDVATQVAAITTAIVALEYAPVAPVATNVAQGKTPTVAFLDGSEMGTLANGDAQTDMSTIGYATDGAYNNKDYHFRYAEGNGERKASYLQIDLGAAYDISEIKMWRYYDNRNYDPTVIAVSDSATDWTDATVVYSSDDDNIYGFGADAVTESAGYAETSEGKTIACEATGQYVRLYANGATLSNGNTNNGNHLVEFQVWGVEATVTPDPEPEVDRTALDAAIAAAADYAEEDYTAESWAVLAAALEAADALAEDASQDDVNAAATAITDAIAALVPAEEGGDDDGVTYEYTNVALNKSVTAALNANQTTGTLQTGATSNDRPLTMAVDGTINTNNYAEIGILDNGSEIKGSAYIQVDLGQVYDVDKVNLYRYWYDGRKYDATVIVLAETEADFGTDAQTIVYNSDTNNVHGLGAGTDDKYSESAAGKECTFEAVSAQYIRVYVNGNNNQTSNTNHIVEIQAWANAEVLPEPEPALKNAETYQDFPTHYQDRASNFSNGVQLHVGGQVVHPDVVYMEDGWNGYKYWIVYTPNTMVTSQYENPYIAASNDGVTWVEPQGISNPIEPEPINKNLHNCDADMIYNEEMDAMMAYWNWANDNNWGEAPLGAEVRVRISYDGVHWGVPSTYDETTGIWTKPANESERTLKPATTDKWGLDNSFITAVASRDRYDMLSPTFTYDSYRDIYVMWANNTGDVGYNNGQNNHVDIRWSKDGLNWSDAQPVSNFLDKTTAGQSLAPWHQDVNYIEELKEYWAFSQCFTGRNPDGSMLYLTRSKDGINWEQVGTEAVMNPGPSGSWDDFQIYRTCFVYKEGKDGEDSKVEVWYSSLQQDTANKKIIDSNGEYTITAGPDDTRIWRIGYTENTYEGIMAALTGDGEKPALVTGTALDLTASETQLSVGDEGQVSVAFTPAETSDQIVKYTSSNEDVLTVTPFGEVIAVGEGTATITAETQDNISDTVEITVGEAETPVVPAGVEWYDVPFDGEDIIYEGSWGADNLGKNTYEADASATLVFYGTGIKWVGQTDSNFGTALVTIDDNEPVEVSTNGSAATGVTHFTAENLTEGVHTITIQPKSQGTSDAGVIDINKFIVQYDKTWDIKVSDVAVQASTDSIRVGKTTTVSAFVQPFNAVNKAVTFESTDESVATVSAQGVVTGVKAGEVTIKVKADGAEGSVVLTVVNDELPAKRITISNEEPLLIVPVYGQAYNADASELQWGDTLLGRWNSIPEDIKDNVIMEIHCMRAAGQVKAFYTQQLEIAQANDIPVMIVTANGGSSQFSGESGAQWLDEAMKEYDCLKGFIITENYWTDYNGVATQAANHLRVAAENGGYLVWYEHKVGVMESILTNAAFRPAVEEFGSNLAFTWKNTPIEQNAATASYMQGLWLEGVIDQWGGLMDSWKWWELGYAELFNPTTSLTNGGRGRGHIGRNSDGDGEETRACVMEPEALLGIQMMSIYANGGTIYSFEHPAYTQGVNDKNTPAFENVIYDTFKYIMENPAPSKEEVIEDTQIMIHGNTSSNPNIFTGVTMKDQALPTYITGQYGLIPSVPASITVDDVSADKVVEFSEVSSMDKATIIAALDELYADSAYEGDAFAQKVNDTWILYNSIYNEADTDQHATVNVSGQSVDVDMEPHTYTIMDNAEGVISVYLNNYRVNKDEIWEGYDSTVWKWDPDVNTLMQDWIEGNYIVNTNDGPETFRDTVYTLTGLTEAPVVEVTRVMEESSKEPVVVYDEETGTAIITITNNGYMEFEIRTGDAAVEEDEVIRIYGEDRNETSYKVADALKEQLGIEKFDTVIVATGKNFADALSGSYLAVVKNAPILLTNGKEKNVEKLCAYIGENLTSDGMIYILGGDDAVSPEVQAALEADHEVKRLYGDSRYDTSIAILNEAGIEEGTDLIVATGKDFADSLSASALKKPILLVKPKAELTDAQKEIAAKAGQIYIVGGTDAVTQGTEDELKAIGTVKRIAGNGRQETSKLVAEEFFGEVETVVLAKAMDFPDGLCGGPLAAAMDAPLLLTRDGKSEIAEGYVQGLGVKSGVVLGGTDALKNETVKDVFVLDSVDEIVEK